jgi:aryl carrier-like protein
MEDTDNATKDDELAARLAAATPDERWQLLTDLVVDRAATILDLPDLDEESNFLKNNLSSLAALRLSKSLMNDTGVEVPLVAIVENPTPSLLGKFIADAYDSEAD